MADLDYADPEPSEAHILMRSTPPDLRAVYLAENGTRGAGAVSHLKAMAAMTKEQLVAAILAGREAA